MTLPIELFVSMAEIAGVFIGFGALISVTRWTEIDAEQLGAIRAVVTIGLVVLVAGLVPVGLDRYGVTGRSLWFISSLIFLALSWGVILLSLRQTESRQLVIAQFQTRPLSAAFFWLMLELPIQIPLLLALFGARPELDSAFYLTALLFNLFEAAFVLAQLVYAEVRS